MAAAKQSEAKPVPSATAPAASRGASAGPEGELRIFADRDGVIREWNARAQALLGHTQGEAVGRSLDLIIPEHLRAAHWRGYHRAITAGQTRLAGTPMVTRAVHKDGRKVYLELAFDLVRNASGEVEGALATGRAVVGASPG